MRLPKIPAGRSAHLRGRPATGTYLPTLAALTATLLLAAGCGGGGTEKPDNAATTSGADTTAVLGPTAMATGEPIRIGVVTEGKTAIGDETIQNRAAQAGVKYLNEHRSGLSGRPIKLVECTTQLDPAKGTDCGNRMIEENVVAVLIGTTAVVQSIWTPLAAAKIPVMLYGTGDEALLTDSESTFVLADPLFPVVDLPLQIAKREHADKVTSIVIDVPAALASQTTIAPPLFKKAGIDFSLVTVPPGTADMTPQMQNVVSRNPGVVFIAGNDAFCISAMNGLRATGYTGTITAVSQCITDATRTAVSAETLDGVIISSYSPIGTDNPSNRLYKTVVDTYGKNIDPSIADGLAMFTVLAGFQTAVGHISGDITPQSVAAAIRSMPEQELPGAGGLRFRCNGKAYPETPAVCLRGGLVATLDKHGDPAAYDVSGNTPIGN
ncbi:ABC transporter substrate-binding protein [Pseudofrankia sp. BMG5.36]|uniref:ABC transporter substrate-binding protein n=1 Tax=Pseudofrankia sp. BMG5.36 TaxID=1834512 RepID=UPI0008D958D8|nr:ABC transporter substrate-binding protein [Pseudofrankia sp. BMG5.36]OHV43702.1 branched-chain amino acid ABC transporter substrate-binding protein [Pseudofrankia sp. BMG5.36]